MLCKDHGRLHDVLVLTFTRACLTLQLTPAATDLAVEPTNPLLTLSLRGLELGGSKPGNFFMVDKDLRKVL